MKRRASRADFFDASALVKVFSDEHGSEIVRPYFHSRSTKYTTAFCLYEALNALKSKLKYKKNINSQQYLESAFKLTSWFGAEVTKIDDLDFTDPLTFRKAADISTKYQLDLSDAFQIVSVKHGYFCNLVNESSTILVTADIQLANAARTEGLRVWNLLLDQPPE
jgi:predicted nucleic acid-binding protein